MLLLLLSAALGGGAAAPPSPRRSVAYTGDFVLTAGLRQPPAAAPRSRVGVSVTLAARPAKARRSGSCTSSAVAPAPLACAQGLQRQAKKGPCISLTLFSVLDRSLASAVVSKLGSSLQGGEATAVSS